MKIINLDKLILDDKEVVLSGKRWLIPGETSLDTMVEILKNAQELENNPQNVEANEKAFKVLWELFIIRQPDLEFKDFKKMLTVNQYVALVNFIYSDNSNGEKEIPEKKISRRATKKI